MVHPDLAQGLANAHAFFGCNQSITDVVLLVRTIDECRIIGQPTAPGLAIGQAFVYRNRVDALSVPRSIRRHEIEEELGQVERAVETVRDDLQVSARRIEADTGPNLAAIFEAHEAMLEDPTLREEIREEIERELVNAAQALVRVFDRWEERFRQMPQATQQKHADDLLDLRGRLLREMAGVKTTALEKMPQNRVLVAHRLLPSETVALPHRAVIGIVLEFGGLGSHAALLARALGIPTVAQIPKATERISNEDQVIVDGDAGEIVLNPNAATRDNCEERIRTAQDGSGRAKRLCHEPARTLDDVEIEVLANIASRQDALVAAENGADGVGLYRIEQFYLSRKTPPSLQDLLIELKDTFAPLAGKPITVRLLDLGADKPVPFLKFPAEDDPFLGCRGVRLLLRYPDLLDTQFKAFLEFSREFDVRILVPMVTVAEDMAQIRHRLCEVADAAGVSRIPPIGAMIETPAAALSISEIVQHADFFSIGTNDLTQYTMAAGRENPLVNDYFVERHPSVLRLIRIVVEEAGQTPVSICGELASEPGSVPILLKLGMHSLSVAPPLVPKVKEAIRQTHLQGAHFSR
jgi:phosphoenolpyruvate-protein phosphotransferase